MSELSRLIKEGSTEKLWDLSAEILTELSRRDGVDFRIKATPESVQNLMFALELSAMEAGEYYKLRIPIAAEAKSGSNWAEVH